MDLREVAMVKSPIREEEKTVEQTGERRAILAKRKAVVRRV
jgi:hypothetical protein